MHRDKKLGLALGVLLIGIVAAFCFRNENSFLLDFPRLEDPQKLDDRIAEKPMIPYLTGVEGDDRMRGGLEKPVQLEQPESVVSPATGHRLENGRSALWQIPEFLKPTSSQQSDPLAQSPTAPDPIRIEPRVPQGGVARSDVAGIVRKGIRNPDHNQAWAVAPSEPTKPEATRPPGTVTRTVSEKVHMHRVETGETLSELALRYLGSSARYLDIFEANRDLLKDPNDLRAGMQLRIPQPGAAKTTTGGPVPSSPAMVPPQEAPERAGEPGHGQRRVVEGINVSTGNQSAATLPTAPVSTDKTASGSQPIRRFLPVPRFPLVPRRFVNEPALPQSIEAPKPETPSPAKRTLSQLPPDALPNVD